MAFAGENMTETMKDRTVDDAETLQQVIAASKAALVYFSGPDCNVCKVLRPKLMELAHARYPEMERIYVNVAAQPALGVTHSVFAVPTVLVFLEGREFARKSRAFSPAELMDELARPWALMMDA
jgi:thioredoxin 1